MQPNGAAPVPYDVRDVECAAVSDMQGKRKQEETQDTGGQPFEKAKPAEEATPAKKAKPAKKATAKAPKCKCPACEKCNRDPASQGDFCYGVECGRECPACALFHEMFKKDATFKVDDKEYPGCCTCKIINKSRKVSNICRTCFVWSCQKSVRSFNEEDPLAGNEVRLYGKGGKGLAGGIYLRTMPITQARELFTQLKETKSLARLTPEGAEGAMKQ